MFPLDLGLPLFAHRWNWRVAPSRCRVRQLDLEGDLCLWLRKSVATQVKHVSEPRSLPQGEKVFGQVERQVVKKCMCYCGFVHLPSSRDRYGSHQRKRRRKLAVSCRPSRETVQQPAPEPRRYAAEYLVSRPLRQVFEHHFAVLSQLRGRIPDRRQRHLPMLRWNVPCQGASPGAC